MACSLYGLKLADFSHSRPYFVMMATAEDLPPAGVVANWVTSQKGTPLLRDDNNFNYRIHMKNKEGTQANYRCVKHYTFVSDTPRNIFPVKKTVLSYIDVRNLGLCKRGGTNINDN